VLAGLSDFSVKPKILGFNIWLQMCVQIMNVTPSCEEEIVQIKRALARSMVKKPNGLNRILHAFRIHVGRRSLA